jgi:hypothetical protein
LANLTWRLFAISSGEMPLEDASSRRAAGEQVRHIDIAVPGPNQAGIFDRLSGTRRARVREAIRLAAQVETTISENYGVARTPYLAKLVVQRDELRGRVGGIVAEFIKAVGADTDPWERRFASKFALICAGLILAAEFGVAPFDAAHARRTAIRVYRIARRSVFTIEETVNDVVQRIREALDGNVRFPPVKKGESLPAELRGKAWGFRRKHEHHGNLVAIDPGQFERLAGSKAKAEAVLDLLIGRRIAIRGSNGKRRLQIAVQGFNRIGRGRWVCLHIPAVRTWSPAR